MQSELQRLGEQSRKLVSDVLSAIESADAVAVVERPGRTGAAGGSREESRRSQPDAAAARRDDLGVTLQDFENGRFVVLLLGTDIQTQRWSVGGRPAVRLSSE